MEHSLLQHSLPHGEFTSSETEGLNLNLFVPSQCKGSLPVFVYVHGGGFTIGSGAWPQYDLTGVVKLSNQLGTPVIGVTIKYVAFCQSTTKQMRTNTNHEPLNIAIDWGPLAS